jgi:acyl-coenzyme A synthetase/AMP-(fatty) acid ligase
MDLPENGSFLIGKVEKWKELNYCLHEIFEKNTKDLGDKIAIVYQNEKLTFKELHEKTTLLSKYLVHKGVLVDDIIGIYMEKCIEYVIAYISILKGKLKKKIKKKYF